MCQFVLTLLMERPLLSRQPQLTMPPMGTPSIPESSLTRALRPDLGAKGSGRGEVGGAP